MISHFLTKKFLQKVETERRRQDEKWGEQNHSPEVWCAILLEEVGEVAAAILEDNTTGYNEELAQVAAVACVMWESFVRNEFTFVRPKITPFGKGDKSRRNDEPE